ncbi:DNA gyrase inhibitor YacG [Alysiella filiformis]|uniref:DNA gyrase inhibitor YacG n=1 Tax=Alysiella filiformis DSM 16848 TaxID=1120981 RepID=A0A286EGL3_9NEIS|nr:DNA gyrase inhibitor YacG [Alysiella filiformis]QMT31801.1 DNA gyrase inhibitor YacG [Alysiella filiformis]UBQ55186.1 DNA gyrase inhibitor YacG [Alysiella filiformis DSM 16848]SOD70053.1 hypothetical protein SAMN02746062_01948 [Alysiella filiformis DSM 16848]
MSEIVYVKCPTCQTQVAWLPENAHRPFCSEKCQLIDLGEWASENRTIVAQANWHDLDD